MNDHIWIKSSYSGGNQANCVEIAALPHGGRAVRDSKNPEGAILVLTPGQWSALRTACARFLRHSADGEGAELVTLGVG
jgi:hypothetical protein